MSRWSYFVTAQPPTVVTHVVCPIALTSSQPTDLVVARGTRLEVLRLGTEGGAPSSVCKLPVNGRVCGLQALRPPGASQDLLVLLTKKRQLVVLRFLPEDMEGTGRLVAVATGRLRRSREEEFQMLFACDPGGRAVATYVDEGLLEIAALGVAPALVRAGTPEAAEAGAAGAMDLGAEDLLFSTQAVRPQLLDLAFLHPPDAADLAPEEAGRPLLATLQADRQDLLTLRLWSADLVARSVLPAGSTPVKAGVSRLAPVPPPYGGLLLLGGGSATYCSAAAQRLAWAAGGPREVAAVACRTGADGPMWLLGDPDGLLWLLRLQVAASGSSSSSRSAPAPKKFALSFEQLGLSSPPSALAWLGDDRAFVGSAMGDSQFIRLSAGAMGDSAFLVEDTWMNLGPIVDFCTADVDGRGQSQVVACSGNKHTGSLRLLRIGVGVKEAGALDGLSGVLGLWSLPGVGGGALALGFAGCTRVLALQPGGAELEEWPAPGFSCGEESLLCCEAEGIALQITRTGLSAASLDCLDPVVRWTPPRGSRMQVAASAPGGAVVALGDPEGEILLLRASGEMGGGCVEVASTWRLGAEVSCLHARFGLCVAGLWTRALQYASAHSR